MYGVYCVSHVVLDLAVSLSEHFCIVVFFYVTSPFSAGKQVQDYRGKFERCIIDYIVCMLCLEGCLET